jgi:hypothetical protein
VQIFSLVGTALWKKLIGEVLALIFRLQVGKCFAIAFDALALSVGIEYAPFGECLPENSQRRRDRPLKFHYRLRSKT